MGVVISPVLVRPGRVYRDDSERAFGKRRGFLGDRLGGFGAGVFLRLRRPFFSRAESVTDFPF